MLRIMVWLGLIAVVAGEACAQRPIPQDQARIEKRRKDRVEWTRKTLQGAYDKVGKRSPKWDSLARNALELAAKEFNEQTGRAISNLETYKACEAAINAGCDDPQVVYIARRTANGADGLGPKESNRRLAIAAKSLAESSYPRIRRAMAGKLAAQLQLTAVNLTAADREEAERWLDAALALLPESFAKDERGEFLEDKWYDTLIDLRNGYRRLGLDAQAAFDRVDAPLRKIPEWKVLELQFRASHLNALGAEARSERMAADVPPEQMTKFVDCLTQASKLMDEAWKLRPGSARTANMKLAFELGTGGDRAVMELWFDRAMKADGDLVMACVNKMEWLSPKWYGTDADMLAFGKACTATKNWRAGITLVGPDAHFQHAVMLRGDQELEAYMSRPEVWAVTKSTLEEYLKHFPDANAVRSKYAVYAYLSRQFDVADAQFKILGERLTPWVGSAKFSLADMQQFRAEAAVKAGKETTPKPTAKPKRP